jgi:hypothetical protein
MTSLFLNHQIEEMSEPGWSFPRDLETRSLGVYPKRQKGSQSISVSSCKLRAVQGREELLISQVFFLLMDQKLSRG